MTHTSLILINRTLCWAGIELLTEQLCIFASGDLHHYTTDASDKIMQFQQLLTLIPIYARINEGFRMISIFLFVE